MLAERRDEMTPDEVYDMLQDKCTALLEGVASVNESRPAVTSPEATASENEATADALTFEEQADANPEPEPVKEPEPEPVKEPDPQPVPVKEPIKEPVPAKEPVKESAGKPVTLTLNDKFRFRRSLFGGSDSRMTETIAILASISDPDDITDFITNDLCWDPEDPEVTDFLAVVAAAR